MVTVGSLFDGIGGTLLCAKVCGAKPIWASEIEPFPIKVTEHHFPDVKHYGDITDIKGEAVEPVDIIVGGSPCQDLSVAGKREGMSGERSGLFMEQIRIIKEMRHATKKQPRYMVWENVPGAFSSNKGEDFRVVLEETAKIADPTVSIPRSDKKWATSGSILGDGYSISWRTFDAQYWGVPQRRRRIYLVADFAGQSAPKILFESESVSGDITESGKEGQETARDTKGCADSAVVCLNDQGGSVMDVSDKAATLRAEQHGHQPVICYESHPMDSRVTGPHKVSPTVTSHFHKGSADTPLVLANCLDAEGGVGNAVCYDMTHACDVIRESGDKTPTLKHRMGTGGNNVPITIASKQISHNIGEDIAAPIMANDYKEPQAVCYGISAYASNAMRSNNPHSGVYEASTSRTIDQTGGNPSCHQGGIAVCSRQRSDEFKVSDVVSTQSARQYKDATDLVVASVDCRNLNETQKHGTLQAKENGGQSLNYSGAVRIEKQVRRLTPLECERLQGYPDNYTNITGASDTARYKALGNSFAIPNILFVLNGCVQYILKGEN